MQKTPKPKEQGGKSQKFEGNHNNHPVWTTKPQSPQSILQPYPNPPSLKYHPHCTPPKHTNLSTIEQVRSTIKWASLFSCCCCCSCSCCCCCCCFRSCHKCSSKAPQMTSKSLPKLQETEDEKGEWPEGQDFFKWWLSSGNVGLLLNWPILTDKVPTPSFLCFRNPIHHHHTIEPFYNWTSAKHY